MRFSVSKLDGGKIVQFKVDLETPEQGVLCHLVCEDIGLCWVPVYER